MAGPTLGPTRTHASASVSTRCTRAASTTAVMTGALAPCAVPPLSLALRVTSHACVRCPHLPSTLCLQLRPPRLWPATATAVRRPPLRRVRAPSHRHAPRSYSLASGGVRSYDRRDAGRGPPPPARYEELRHDERRHDEPPPRRDYDECAPASSPPPASEGVSALPTHPVARAQSRPARVRPAAARPATAAL